MRQPAWRPWILVAMWVCAGCAPSASPLQPGGPPGPSTDTASPGPGPAAQPPFDARYRVTFTSSWSATSHPQDFPADAHFSGLIGAVHDATGTFWQPGAVASVGIQAMAERGSKAQLQQEVERAITAGTAGAVLSGGNLAISPGAATMEFHITQAFPRVTLVTMIAPSPDWFVGVSGVSLFASGGWVERLEVPLAPYDAGTDSGVTFTSADVETRPHQPIAAISGYPFLNGLTTPPLGSFVFERLP